MPKRSDPALDLAAIAFLPPDLASALVHVAYLGERPGRYQGRIPLTRKLTLQGVPCPASSLAWTRGIRTQPEPLAGVNGKLGALSPKPSQGPSPTVGLRGWWILRPKPHSVVVAFRQPRPLDYSAGLSLRARRRSLSVRIRVSLSGMGSPPGCWPTQRRNCILNRTQRVARSWKRWCSI